jgi:aminocarboxymuconate-semialdehyde decarboxylase
VLDAYPGLKLVIAHGGGFLPAYSAQAALPDTREHIHHDPTDYLKRLY